MGVFEVVAQVFESAGVVVAVADALVADDLVVHVLVLHGLAVTVQLHLAPLGAEGQEHRQVAEVVDVVVNGADAQRAQVGDDHRAVEGADAQQRHRQPVEVVGQLDELDGQLQQQARRGHEDARGLLRAAVVAGADLLHGVVHLAVDVINGVRQLEIDLRAGLLGVHRDAALDHHIDGDGVAGVDTLAGDEAVEARQVAEDAYVGGDEEVDHAQALVALGALGAQPAVRLRYLHGAGKLVAGVVAVDHDEGREGHQGGDGAQAPAFLAVAEAAAGVAHLGTPPYVRAIINHYNT